MVAASEEILSRHLHVTSSAVAVLCCFILWSLLHFDTIKWFIKELKKAEPILGAAVDS